MNNESKGMLLGLVGVSAFGLTLPATRMVVPYLDPVFIGLGRSVMAALFAVALLLVSRQNLPTLKQAYRLAIVALGVVIGFPIFSSLAMLSVPASHGGVIAGILPLTTALVGVLISNERPSLAFWLASGLGASLVIGYALLQGSGALQMGDFALLAAIFSAAIGYAVGGKLATEMGGWQVICWALALAFPFIIIPTINHAPTSFLTISLAGYASFFYLALVSQLLAFFAWYKGLALGGIARVSQAQLVQPFITLLAAALMLGEVIGAETILFAGLVVGSVWLGKRAPIRQKA